MIKHFFTDKSGKVVLTQKPNAPIIVWLTATILKLIVGPDNVAYSTLDVVSLVGITAWALLEIVQGDSLFRRSLGLFILCIAVYGRLNT